KVVASENVLIRELAGEAVLLNLDNEQYFGLDDIGYRMWEVLTTSDTIGDAMEILLSEYDVESDRLLQSINDLIEKCAEHGLLHVQRPE
ncbi:MAG: PqqD family protein, partial [bacterium]|nr:PqqD family protein [bacterium]